MTTSDLWWDYSQRWAGALADGVEPPTVAVYGPILDDNEQARLCTTAPSKSSCENQNTTKSRHSTSADAAAESRLSFHYGARWWGRRQVSGSRTLAGSSDRPRSQAP